MLEKKYQLYVFDMDGTLLDSSSGIINAVCHTLKSFNKDIPDAKILKSFIGPPLKTSFSLLPDVDDTEVEKLVNNFREEYREREIFNANLYDGIIPLLKRLRSDGIRIAVATNKPEIFAKRLVAHFGLDAFIPVVCGTDMKGSLNKAELLRRAIVGSGIDKKEFVAMVGDTASDAKAANECGVDFIGVKYGFGIFESVLCSSMVKMVEKPEDIY